VGWPDVVALVGNFKEGFGYLIMKNGVLVGTHTATPPAWNPFANTNPASPAYSAYTKRCFRCHNPTGFDTANEGDSDNRAMYGVNWKLWTNALRASDGTTVLQSFSCGAPALDPFGKRIQGVQCEHCHGSAGSMEVPSKLICVNCHSSTDPTDPSVALDAMPNRDANGLDTWDSNKRFVFAPTADGKTGVFTSRHPQGDEFRRSPHKNVTADGEPQGCVLCHDPHKSVWHEKGGVKYTGGEGGVSASQLTVGNMCKACHQQTHAKFPNAKKVRVRGVMGMLECTDCHMPEKSQGRATAGVANEPLGEGFTHLFKINPDVVHAADNVSRELSTPWMANWPDAKKTYNNYWKSTDRDGDSFLTCDLVCTTCHSNMTAEKMAEFAKGIHRQPGVVDVTANNGDTLQRVKKGAEVSVNFSIEAGEAAGKTADLWVICQGPKGWSYWHEKTKTWKLGLKATKRIQSLADTPEQNVLKTTRSAPGQYTYWVMVTLTTSDDEYVDSVPVYVTKK
jgi:hypothetical protein